MNNCVVCGVPIAAGRRCGACRDEHFKFWTTPGNSGWRPGEEIRLAQEECGRVFFVDFFRKRLLIVEDMGGPAPRKSRKQKIFSGGNDAA